jgi:hypothetical protein
VPLLPPCAKVVDRVDRIVPFWTAVAQSRGERTCISQKALCCGASREERRSMHRGR